jgi:hypothetical protein
MQRACAAVRLNDCRPTRKCSRITVRPINKTNSVAWARKRTIPTGRPPIAVEVGAKFLRIEGCRVVRAADPLRLSSRISRPEPLLFFQVAPQLYSWGWVDHVPVPLLVRKSGNTGNRTRPLDLQPGTLATRPQRWSTFFYITYKFSLYHTGNTIHIRSAARNSDHKTTEAVYFLLHNIYKFSSYHTGNTIHLRSAARNSDH